MLQMNIVSSSQTNGMIKLYETKIPRHNEFQKEGKQHISWS